MKTRSSFLVLTAVFLGAHVAYAADVAVACPQQPLPPGTSERALSVGGEAHRYSLTIPAMPMPKGGYPLILAIADAGVLPNTHAELTGLRKKAETTPFVLASLSARDDAEVAKAILSDVKQLACLDPQRVFVAGHGTGATLAQRLGCDSAKTLAAVATVAGRLRPDTCGGGVALLAIEGVADRCVPPAAASGLEAWRAKNGCAKRMRVVRKSGDATCKAFDGCKSDVEQCVLEGVGHVWPGAEGSPEECGGKLASDFNASDWIWSFFLAHPKRS